MDLLRSQPLKDLVKAYGIALTGGVATGKSTVAAMLRNAGFLVIDADQLSRDVTAPGTPGLKRLVAAFGKEILTGDALDRKRLGDLVFNDPVRRRVLESLTHPMIREALGAQLEAVGLKEKPRPFFYEAALIFETKTEGDFRAVWATTCTEDQQKARLMTRSGLSADAAERIIASQMPASEKAARAQVSIDTSGTLADVEAQVKRHLAKLPSGDL